MNRILLIAFMVVITIATAVNADDYCSIPCWMGRHTMCDFKSSDPAQSCGEIETYSLSDDEKSDILLYHNKMRHYVASGREHQGNPGPQPSARNLNALVWDEELALIAQRWANQCHFRHDSCRDVQRFRVGQNIGFNSIPGGFDGLRVEDVMESWYDEVNDFDRNLVADYQWVSGSITSHYTQMIWGETTSVGCGVVKYKKNELYTIHLVCNYGPVGNTMGMPVYT